MTLLAIEWSNVAVKAGQFILSFSILVVLHELGHFIPAKIFKCRVEKFYLFFNPWFSLFKIKRGETEYGIGWVPFGGFVKISGMIDESMDKNQLKLPPEPHEFRSKPAWQRLIIMVGGVVVNVLLAIAIFIGISAYWGDEDLPTKNLKYGIATSKLAQSIGLQDGDNIVAVDGKPLENFNSIAAAIILEDTKNLQVKRNNSLVNIAIPNGFAKTLAKDKNEIATFAEPRYPVVVDAVSPTAQITKGELKKGDTIFAINNFYFGYYHQMVDIRNKFNDSIVNIYAKRGADTVIVRVLIKSKMIGFTPVVPARMFGTVTTNYTFAEAIPVGYKKTIEALDRYIAGIKKIINRDVSANDSLGSVISIGNTFPGVWDWQTFWTLTGVFSIILAFMNILPIPALDGGHALFTLFEMITGKKPSDKFMEYAQIVGMVLLLSLMVYALGLDFWRLLR